jgi:two-component system LytT family response regulator
MIRTIIIDDEMHCIDRLTGLVKEYHADTIEILGACKTAEEGLRAIQTLRPELVFLDIQIHDTIAFDLLRQIGEIDFEVIFTTAFDKYAVEAFRFSAIDYLLKPIVPEELQQSVKRLEKKIAKDETAQKLDTLFHNFKNIQGASRRIAVPVMNGLVFIQVSDIIRCESAINYTTLFLKDKQKLTVARTLREFEELLTNANFYRVHNSHLVNLAYIKNYNKGKGGILTMTDNSQVEVSTRRKDDFLKRLSEL